MMWLGIKEQLLVAWSDFLWIQSLSYDYVELLYEFLLILRYSLKNVDRLGRPTFNQFNQ